MGHGEKMAEAESSHTEFTYFTYCLADVYLVTNDLSCLPWHDDNDTEFRGPDCNPFPLVLHHQSKFICMASFEIVSYIVP